MTSTADGSPGSSEDSASQDERRDDLRWAAFGGLAAALIGFTGMAVVGRVSAFEARHYQRIRDIAALTTAVIVASVLLLMFLSFPIGESQTDGDFHLWVYYAVLFGAAATGGTFISVILMLYYAVRQLIGVGEDATSSALIVTDDD